MGILRDTYIINKTDNSGVEYEMKKRNDILKQELENKNRVDISLQEYTKMVEENKSLKEIKVIHERFLKELGNKLQIDSDVLLKSKNLKVEVSKNHFRMSNIYHIQFEVEDRDYR